MKKYNNNGISRYGNSRGGVPSRLRLGLVNNAITMSWRSGYIVGVGEYIEL